MSVRRRWVLSLQITVAIVAVAVIWRQVPPQEVLELLARLSPGWAVLAGVAVMGAWGCSALRLQRVLRVFGISVSARHALAVNGYGAWYSLFLPGAVSGDVAKAFHVRAAKEHPAEVASAITCDKAIGLLPLLALGAGASWGIPLDLWVKGVLTASIPLAVAVIWMAGYLPFPRRFTEGKIGTLQTQWRAFLRQPRDVAQAFFFALGTHLFLSGALGALALGMGEPGAAWAAMVAYAVGSVVAVIPLTIAGIGLREGAFASILVIAGYSASLGVTLSLFLLTTLVVYGAATWIHGIREDITSIVRAVWNMKHAQAVLMSALIATAIVAPLGLFPVNEPRYQGIYMSAASDEEHYVAIIREVAEGRVLHQNTYLYEEKDAPMVMAQWGDIPLGALFALWPGSVGSFVLIVKWLGLFATSWALLYLLARITPQLPFIWRAASVAGFFVLPSFIGPTLIPRAWEALQGQGPWTEFLSAVRLTNPVATAFVWIISLITLERLWKEARWRTAATHGVVVGILAWMYFYFWAFTIIATGVVLLWRFVQRGWQEARWHTAALIIATGISIPMFWLLAIGLQSAGDGQTSFHAASHAPIIEKSLLAIGVLLVAWMLLSVRRIRKTPEPHQWFLVILLLTTVIAVNQQVITGISIQPHHFYFFTNLPIAGLILMIIVGSVVCWIGRKTAKMVMGAACLVLLLWMGIGVQVATARHQWEEYVDRQRFMPAFQEINRRQPPLVVLSDTRLSELIPMYTSADVFYTLHASAYPSTDQERRIFAWHLSAWLQGVRSVEDARAQFTSSREQLGLLVFEGQKYREQCGSYGCFPDKEFEAIVEGYGSFLQLSDAERFGRYRIDLIAWDERRNPTWKLEQYPFLTRVWSGEGVSLWALALE